MIKGVKNRVVHCDLQWHQTLSLTLKKNCRLRDGATQAASLESFELV